MTVSLTNKIIFLLLCSVCMAVSLTTTSFNTGQVSPLLEARIDFQKYQSSNRTVENMFVSVRGSAVRRGGTRFVATSPNGDPIELDPNCTQIYTAADFDNIRNDMGTDRCYELMNNIDLSGFADWEVFGAWEDRFLCELNGNGYTVSGMTQTTIQDFGDEPGGFSVPARWGMGLIGIIGLDPPNAGYVHDIIIEVDITVPDSLPDGAAQINYIGGLAGVLEGSVDFNTIYKVKVTGTITGGALGIRMDVGGISAYNHEAKVEECLADVDITLTTGLCIVGGFFGSQVKWAPFGSSHGRGILDNCYATGNISVTANNLLKLGGFVGLQNEHLVNMDWTNCYASGNIFGASTGNRFVGGFVADLLGSHIHDPWGKYENLFGYGTLDGFVEGGFVARYNPSPVPLNEINTHYKNNGNDGDSIAIKQTDAYFKAAASGVYTGDVIWDFVNVWEIDEGVSLPTLQWLSNLPEIQNPTVRLIPFTVSTDDSYALEFGNQYIRFFRDSELD